MHDKLYRWLYTSHLPVLALIPALYLPVRLPVSSAKWGESQIKATLYDKRLDEISGMAIDPDSPDLIWTHNDSGDKPHLYLIDVEGKLRAQVRLLGAPHYDYEDMDIGPCQPNAPTPRCIFVADIGDNKHKRDHVQLYRAPLPALTDKALPDPFELRVEATEHIRYPQGPHDAETLMVHPKTGQRIIVLKARLGPTQVMLVPEGPSSPQNPKQTTLVAKLEIDSQLPSARLITAGQFSPDGRCAILRSYIQVRTYCAPNPNPTLAQIFAAPPDLYSPPSTIQAEALAIDPRDGALWMTSERWPAPLIRVAAAQAAP